MDESSASNAENYARTLGGNLLKKIKVFFANDIVIAIALFVVAALIRTIPEIKAGVWPIGYDTFNTYAAELASYNGSLLNWLKTANLLYFIFLPFKLCGVDPGLLMKISGPVFFGGLIASFYYWARGFVGFSKLKAFLASSLIIFQLATLRISWDLYRNELGLILLFMALINLAKITKKRNFVLFTILSLLIVLSHELVTVILIVIVGVYGFSLLFHKKYGDARRLLIPAIIIALTFAGVLFADRQSLYNPNISFISENKNVIWRYFYQYQKSMPYDKLFSAISQLFWLFYQFLLPFALFGFWLLRKKLILSVLTLWLLVGTFSSLIFAGTGIMVWERWLVMLAFPFAIYTVEGIYQCGQFIDLKLKKWHFHLRPCLWLLSTLFWVVFLSLFIWRAFPFLTKDYNDAKAPLANDELNNYFPRTMVHNSVGIWKIEDTFNCVEWLNERVPSGAVVLVDNRYRGLMMTGFELDGRSIITNNWSDQWSKKGLQYAKEKGFSDVYLIWKYTTIKGFDRIYVSGNVAVYIAKTEDVED